MKLTFLILLLVFFTSCSHQIPLADREPTSEQQSVINWNRFELVEYMPEFGQFRNQKVENKRRRPLVFLTYQEKQNLQLPTDQLIFANFRHAGTFYVASIPGIKVDEKNNLISMSPSVEKVVLSEKHWSQKIRRETKSIELHAELTFFLKPSSQIQFFYNQDKKQKLNQVRILKEPLVYSVEAVRSEKFPNADFFPAALGPNLAIVHRIESNTERNIQHKEDPDRTITSTKLLFTNTVSKNNHIKRPEDALLYQALQTSYEKRRKETYQAVLNNCIGNLLSLIDNAVIYKQKINTQLIKAHVLKYNKTELPLIIQFLKEQKLKAQINNEALDRTVDDLISELIQYNESQLDHLTYSEGFMLSFPGFIHGHLKARGLK